MEKFSKVISYGRQSISSADVESVVEVLQSDYLTQGPKVAQFEKDFAQFLQADFAFAVNNGTAGLHLAVKALGIPKGKKIICTPLTFAATANAVLYEGGTLEFVDINPNTYNICVEKVEGLLKANPDSYAGIMAVDFAGHPADLEQLSLLAKKYGLWLIEDACHAVGAQFKDSEGKENYCGNGKYSDASIFSFHPVKHIACGEGGMVTTNSPKLAKKIELLRTHGITKNPQEYRMKNLGPWYHEMHSLGYNYRMSDINAALGVSQLKSIKQNIEKRNSIATAYSEAFRDLPITLPHIAENSTHAFHLYVIQSKMRDELFQFLKERNIYCQVHYIPVYRHPYYQQSGHDDVHCENTEQYFSKCLSIPMFPTLSEQEFDFIVDSINKFHNN